MFGKKYFGVIRSTFLINEEGKLAEIYRKVKVDAHSQTVLAALKEMA
jgi:peroxiredoxin Q/BCP